MFTRVHLCLLVFICLALLSHTYLFMFSPEYTGLRMFKSYLFMFSIVYLCLALFGQACLPIFPTDYSCLPMFTPLYLCLALFTCHIYLCSPMFT